jgi:phospholipase C
MAISALVLVFLASLSAHISTAQSSPIQHIVILMEENRTFDNFFWTFPNAIGNYQTNSTYCDPSNLSYPNQNCIKPIYASHQTNKDMAHGWTSSWRSYNGGKLNGFLSAEGSTQSMWYYNATTLPVTWYFAEHYTLSDMMFSSVMSYSQPAHWFMIAGQSPRVSILQGAQQEAANCYNPTTKKVTWATCTYLQQAQKIQTMADLLTANGISWTYYDTVPASTLNQEIIASNPRGSNPDALGVYTYWNPLITLNRSYTNPAIRSNIVPRSNFFTDVANGNLPSVSWVIPSVKLSDHAPANLTLGEWWIDDVVSTIMQSKYWSNTVMVVTWDDYGGFFDTIKPPVVSDLENYKTKVGLGFRVPALIISPYSKQGITNEVFDFESTLRFIEDNWNLRGGPAIAPDGTSCLVGVRDCIANSMAMRSTSLKVRCPRCIFH